MVREASPERAAAAIRPGDFVFVDTPRPTAIAEALAERADLENVTVYVYGYPYDDPAPMDALATTPGVTVRASMAFPGVRDLLSDGTVGYSPQSLFATSVAPFPETVSRRVAVLQLPHLDGDELPVSCLSTFGASLVDRADAVLAEVNPEHPPATCHSVERSAIDYAVRAAGAPPTMSRDEGIGSAERRVAENVREVLPERPTLQLGIGRVATALGNELRGGPRLDLRSGLLGTGARRIVEGGNVDSVTGCVAIGPDREFYRWVRERPDVSLYPARVVHDPGRIAENERFTAVNSSLQVDLTGQVNAEAVGGRHLGGIGGQLDFMHAACASPDGRAILAATARTRGGHPRIVPEIGPDDPVTTPRQLVDAVVTEHGVANLRHRPLRARAEALIDVAAPDDRPTLREAAERTGDR